MLSLPLPLSNEDNKALAGIIPDTASLGIWLDVFVSDTNEYTDTSGNKLKFTADLHETNQGIGVIIFILIYFILSLKYQALNNLLS